MIGQKIGSYQVQSLLGEGGMGRVFAGCHVESRRRVAIKVLRPELASDSEMAARFTNEARAINGIKHSGVVQIYEVGRLDNQTAYMVMEFLSGESLRSRLRKPEGGGVQALEVAHQIALALAAVHEQKIIHRDLKPENVMLVANPDVPGGEQVKLLDFGIAKRLTNTQLTAQFKTRTGTLVGTPTYMAPEQCGGPGEICDRTDVYALAIMLYEMLAGRPPFLGEEDFQLIGKHLFGQPPPLAELLPATPPDLAALVERMLAKQPADRPAMREVAEALGPLRMSAGALALRSVSDATTVVRGEARDNVSTLHHATGQRRPQRLPPLRWRTLLIGGAALSLAVAMGALTLRILPRPRATSSAPPAAPAAAVSPPASNEGRAETLPPPVSAKPPASANPRLPAVPKHRKAGNTRHKPAPLKPAQKSQPVEKFTPNNKIPLF